MASDPEGQTPPQHPDNVLENELRTVVAERDDALDKARALDLRLRSAQMACDARVEDARAGLLRQREEAVLQERARVRKAQDKDVFRRVQSQRLKQAARGAAPGESLLVNAGLGAEYFYASQHHKDVWVLERLAMQNQSLAARRVIGRAVTALGPGLDQVLRVARYAMVGALDRSALQVYDTWSKRSLLSLARVVADQNLLDDDVSTATELYHLAWLIWGSGVFDDRHALIFTELLEDSDSRAMADRFREESDFDSRFRVQASLLSANRKARAAGHGPSWIAELNALLTEQGLATIHSDGGDDLLGSLRADAPFVDGPLVTVIMPTYNGSAHLRTAIQSVLWQSWRNLELVIVDDCSDESHLVEVAAIIPDDPRVTFVSLREPAGAYGARMNAFRRSTGEFVTIHDDDDWSHPQKIERQVQHLIENPDEIANMSFQTRIDADGLFLRINDNPSFSQPNYSSLLIRRTDVEALGAWDVVNRGADAEFHDRVRLLTGKRITTVETPPLSFMRARVGSLTHGEIRRGALDPARVTYSLSASAWHQQLTHAGQPRTMIGSLADETGRLPFPAPENFGVRQRDLAERNLEVVLATDTRFPGGNSTLAAAELEALSRAGLEIGAIHLPSPVLRSRRPMSPRMHTVISSHQIPLLSVQDSISSDLLLLRHPTVAQFIDNIDARVRSRRTLLIANTPPLNSDGREFCYEIEECAHNAKHAFGGDVLVVAESPQTGRLLRQISPDLPIAEFTWPGFMQDDDISTQPRRNDTARIPTVGRHSRDHRLKWPDSAEEITQAYLGQGAFLTTVLGGASSITDIVDLSAHGVRVIEFGAQEPADYLRGVDFWVYQHSREWTESFGMAILEAMASGCVVILPQYLQDLFGEGALYCEASEVRDLVRETWNSSERYFDQSSRALETARLHYSSTAYLSRVRAIISGDLADG